MATTTSGSSHAKEERDNLLREPREDETFETIERVKTSYESPEHNNELKLDYSNRKYGQQYANIYFMRLEKLRNEAFKAGREAWNGKEVSFLLISKPIGVCQNLC
jgi:DNA polymerase II small subunit/DNA polymerase delta subunit B